jgi:hypothetical protein
VAVGGGTRCAAALLSSAAAPDLVDVVRVQPAESPLAAAAVAALAALAAAPGGTAAAVEPLVAFLQPSSAAAAGRAASALLVLTGELKGAGCGGCVGVRTLGWAAAPPRADLCDIEGALLVSPRLSAAAETPLVHPRPPHPPRRRGVASPLLRQLRQ